MEEENNEVYQNVALLIGAGGAGPSAALNRETLVQKVNDLISNDFEKLILILYRLDINENKLRSLLKDHPQTDAAIIITGLMLEREAEKIKSRQEYRRDDNISDEDKW